jgi:hypothetical protein
MLKKISALPQSYFTATVPNPKVRIFPSSITVQQFYTLDDSSFAPTSQVRASIMLVTVAGNEKTGR